MTIWTTADAARYLACEARTVHNYLNQGRLHALPSQWRYVTLDAAEVRALGEDPVIARRRARKAAQRGA